MIIDYIKYYNNNFDDEMVTFLAADENQCHRGRVFGGIGECTTIINPPGHSSSCSNTTL